MQTQIVHKCAADNSFYYDRLRNGKRGYTREKVYFFSPVVKIKDCFEKKNMVKNNPGTSAHKISI
jgi:hypothetical protein